MNYKTYKNLIRKQAWEVAKQYHYDFDELLSEGNLIYVEAQKRYNKNKSKFSTYLTADLNYRLVIYIKKHKKESISINDYLEEDKLDVNKIKTIMENKIYSEDKIISIMEFYDTAINELSNNAREILYCIISSDSGRKPAYRSVLKYYHYYLGWKRKQIEAAWNEIRKWWTNYEQSTCVY